MSNKIMIVGTGNVGASLAFSVVCQRTKVDEMVLVDVNRKDAEGEVMDLRDALVTAPSYVKISAGEYKDAGDCDMVVITAGVPQKPGETRRDLLAKNAKIFRPMVTEIMKSGFDGVFLVISNPMDTLAYLTWQYSGLPSEQVIGSGTVLDSARLRFRIAERLGVNPKSVHAYQVGEHGDSEFALWSDASLGGQPIMDLIPEADREEIEDFARNEAYRIIEWKGATYYGIGAAATQIVNCVLGDERRVLPVSSYDDFADVYNGFPAVVGRQGIIRRLNIRMSEEEAIRFQQSVNALKETLREV